MRRLVLIAGLLGVMTLGGCAVGRGADGGPVVGFRLGSPEPESIGEVAGLLGGMLPPPWGQIATGAGILGSFIFGGANGKRAGRNEAAADAERVRREAEGNAWDAGRADLLQLLAGGGAGSLGVGARGVPAGVPAVPVATEVTNG